VRGGAGRIQRENKNKNMTLLVEGGSMFFYFIRKNKEYLIV
jgi:hypothetical protein